MYPRLFQLGPLAIPTSGALTAIGIMAAMFVARSTASWLGLDREKVWDLGITGVMTALIAPRLIVIFSNWSDFLAHPLWMLSIVTVRSRAAAISGLTLAIAGMAAFAFFARLPFRRTLDALAPALALGFAIYSIGTFAAGSNSGTSTSLPWAVIYTRRLASLWYGTPLGTPLHPVQLYAALIELCLLMLLLAMIARQENWRVRNGEIMGAWLFLHGGSVFALNFLRSGLGPKDFLIGQSLAATLALAGGLLWLL